MKPIYFIIIWRIIILMYASVSGRNRIQIVYSPSKHQVVYGNGNLCPILTQEVVSSKEVYSLDENEAIAAGKKSVEPRLE